ncbi:N-formylglutamate amidohydrolase [Nocardioides sp.]|uniref:N-formylglutamate amidohydrolase n=1 Tax=Nocardioides sp. TaxID=35761 RepID=UPI002B267ABA|nr:N-formylglutamate amidohydrolase [Nocardioides sp.]
MSAPFNIIPGDPASSVLLHVPHSSRVIPSGVREGIVLSDEEIEEELTAITDADTDEVGLRAAEAASLRPWVFVNRLSRLVVDPERFPDEREEMNAVGMGAVYECTTQLAPLRSPAPEERDLLIATYFEPYAAALATLVRQRLEHVGRVTVLDIHSYPKVALPYERHGDGPRPAVCLGTDSFHTSAPLVRAASAAFEPVVGTDDVGLDSPFGGCYVPLDQHGVNRDVAGLMLELRRDLVASRPEDVAAATGCLVDAIDSPV